MKKLFTILLTALLVTGCGQQNIKQEAAVASAPANHKTFKPIMVAAKAYERDRMSDSDLDALLSLEDEVVDVYDPIEPFNRGMFWFNEKMYLYLLKPLSKGWSFIFPEPIRVSISDFYHNIRAPIRIVNAALQGRGKDAYNETGRFLINTTIGILGFHDVGKDHYNLPRQEIDFGTTLGHWGVGPGFFLTLPFLGPSNARDGIGALGDYYLYPPAYLVNNDLEINTNYVIIRGIEGINEISLDTGTFDAILEQTLDPYLVVRDAYSQHREALIEKDK